MRRLLLLRHAKTERAGPGERDRDRKLTPRGRADATAIGEYMVHQGLIPDLVLVSPAARTEETWALLAKNFSAQPRMARDERIYNAATERLLALARDVTDAHVLLVIGHNPGLHDLAVRLLGSGDMPARERLRENLPTCGLVVVDFAFDDWAQLRASAGRLERFVSPGLIEADNN